MSFWNANVGGMNLGCMDVCKTPIGPIPVPIPYANVAMLPTAVPSQFKVLAMGSPVHNLSTVMPMTMGDSAGVLLGVVSGLVMGPAGAMMGSNNVFVCGPPVAKFGMPAKQNGLSPNIVGSTIAPSQVKVMATR
ncbi:DUF4150 domain-containing protein [Methylobacterium komagatae]|uniref:DUF4150 domain-containing protein n=1 Tax=Methylobacterium komagatae TaxID=374425 RepID=A0ABW2BM41_9HYPH